MRDEGRNIRLYDSRPAAPTPQRPSADGDFTVLLRALCQCVMEQFKPSTLTSKGPNGP